MRRAWLVLAAVSLFAGCAAEEAAPAPPDTSEEGEQRLEEGGFFMPTFGGPVPLRVLVTFSTVEDRPIDVYVATAEMCRLWGTREFVPTASVLDAADGTLDVDVAPGDHCMAFENATFGYGKAMPEGPVTVRFRVDIWRTG